MFYAWMESWDLTSLLDGIRGSKFSFLRLVSLDNYSNSGKFGVKILTNYCKIISIGANLTFRQIFQNYKDPNCFLVDKIQLCMPSLPKHSISVLLPAGENSFITDSRTSHQDTSALFHRISEQLGDKNRPIVFSLNRFWPEKNIKLMVEAAGLILSHVPVL